VAEGRRVGVVTYREAGQDYFDKRQLRRHAGVWSLWALGVAAVISGDFSGWNFGLAYGFGGLLVATIVITLMYFGLCYSIAEMSPALPHTGGAYSFARSAMGPWGGFTTGVAETIEYVVTPAVIVTFTGAYLESISTDLFGGSPPDWIWWLIGYAVFVGLNIIGVEASFRFTVFICLASLAILAVFFIGAIPNFDFQEHAIGEQGWFPDGVPGIFFALPFAIWFYLAIEELPLAAEESADPQRDIPRGTIYGLLTLVATGFLVLFLNSGISPGSDVLRDSDEPLLEGLLTIFGSGTAASLLGLIAVTGLIASFHTIIFAYGRNIFSLSRAGYYPHWLSITHGTRKTPYVALIAGAVIGYGLCWLLREFGTGSVGAALLTMAVFGAVISYFMQAASFVLLRRRLPDIERPFVSPLGEWGAFSAGAIALISLIALFWNSDYRPGVVGVAIFYAVAVAYFALAGRHKLVLSPEEEFATERGQAPRPSMEARAAHVEGGLEAQMDEAPPVEGRQAGVRDESEP
jgi:ethanolamine permease